MFWRCVQSFKPEDRLALLHFATGMAALPPGGFACLPGNRYSVHLHLSTLKKLGKLDPFIKQLLSQVYYRVRIRCFGRSSAHGSNLFQPDRLASVLIRKQHEKQAANSSQIWGKGLCLRVEKLRMGVIFSFVYILIVILLNLT